MPHEITERLLAWYAENARPLPWRRSRDAYAVWVSEIMLQQTRVETVIPYYERWMAHFPDLPSLAGADEQDVLRLWEGLGYYSRVRNLLRSAKIIMETYDGKMPRDRRALEKLPGIGRYTAGAIASIAFNQDEPVLDGNIRRVLARIFDISLSINSPAAEQFFWELAARLLPAGKASDFNQALMDLGATICAPRAPDCERCPVRKLCKANLLGLQSERPVTDARAPVPHHTVTAAVIQRNGLFLIARRPQNGLLGGLWEFPGGKQEPDEPLEACLTREIKEELDTHIEVGEAFGVYEHAYTHFTVTLHAFLCTISCGEPQPVEASALAWAAPADLAAYPMGKIDRQIANRIQRTFTG